MLSEVNEFEKALKTVNVGGAYSSQGLEGTSSKGFNLSLVCPDPCGNTADVGPAGGFGSRVQDRSGVQSLLSTLSGLSTVSPPPTAGQSSSLVSPSQQGYLSGDGVKNNALGVIVSTNIDSAPVVHSSTPTAGGGSAAADQHMFIGMMDFDILSKAVGATGIPWEVQLTALFQMVRKGSWTFTTPVEGGKPATAGGVMDSPRYKIRGNQGPMSATSRGFLEITSKGAVPLQWQMELHPVISQDRRFDIMCKLTKVLMSHHTKVVGEYEQEKKDRQDAEDVISKAYTSGAVPELGKRTRDGATVSKPASKGGEKKPMSLLNPGQRSTVKRAKGVKIG